MRRARRDGFNSPHDGQPTLPGRHIIKPGLQVTPSEEEIAHAQADVVAAFEATHHCRAVSRRPA
jgi:hypothetical protein